MLCDCVCVRCISFNSHFSFIHRIILILSILSFDLTFLVFFSLFFFFFPCVFCVRLNSVFITFCLSPYKYKFVLSIFQGKDYARGSHIKRALTLDHKLKNLNSGIASLVIFSFINIIIRVFYLRDTNIKREEKN